MNETSDCLFCTIAAGDIPAERVQETDTVLAFRDIQPAAPVHVLLIPTEHHETMAELAAAAPEVLRDLLTLAGEVARSEGVAESGYRLISNVGPDSGQEVGHVHLHLLGGTGLGPLSGHRG